MKLVDLAGSENTGQMMINKRESLSDECFREGALINKSLTTLGRVIDILSKNESSSYVPYRESILTKLLKESLGGNSKTAMIATITNENIDHTLSTLRFAKNVCSIVNFVKTNKKPIASVDQTTLLEEKLALEQKLQDLQADLDARNMILKFKNAQPTLINLNRDPSLSELVIHVLPLDSLPDLVETEFYLGIGSKK